MSLPGLTRPIRAAGFALLGVAVVAAAIGTASAVSGDRPEEDTAAPTGEPTPPPDTEETGEVPPSPAPADPPENGDNGENGLDNGDDNGEGNGADRGQGDPDGEARPPADGEPGVPGEQRPSDAVKTEPVRVYNNSNIPRHASRAADDLRSAGWNVVAVSNYADGVIHTTTVYYRPGTSEERAAQLLGEEFGIRVEPRFEGIKDSSAGLIVIVTKDYQGADGSKTI